MTHKLEDATLNAAVIASGVKYRESALSNVATIAFWAVRHGVNGGKRNDMVALMKEAGLTQSTAYRQVGFGFKAATVIRAKLPDHARMVEAKAADTVEGMVTAMLGLFGDMGISDAKDVDAWIGVPLTVEAKAELRAAKEKPKAEAKPEAEAEPKDKPKAEPEPKLTAEELAAKAEADAKAQAEYDKRVRGENFAVAMTTLAERSDDELAAMLKAINAEVKARKAAAKAQLKIAA